MASKPARWGLKKMEELGKAVNKAWAGALQRIRKSINYILIGLVLAAAGFAFYFQNEAGKMRKDPQRVAQEETDRLMVRGSKIIVLPENEIPTIATVNDPEGLSNQPFFAKAKKGDKVLIYTNARKAILYDPENNKIVEVAPLTIGVQAPSPSPQSSTE